MSLLPFAKSIQKRIVDAAANIYVCVAENEEKWTELLQFIVQGLSLQLNEQNLSTIELSLYLLSAVYCTAYDELKEGIPKYKECFTQYFNCNILTLRAKTVKSINEILCSALNKKETKHIRDLKITRYQLIMTQLFSQIVKFTNYCNKAFQANVTIIINHPENTIEEQSKR